MQRRGLGGATSEPETKKKRVPFKARDKRSKCSVYVEIGRKRKQGMGKAQVTSSDAIKGGKGF